jgi:hypothetical protein
VDVRLRESEDQTELFELFFDTEESEVVRINGGKFHGGILQGEGKNIDFGTSDISREIGIGTINGHAGFFPGNNSGWILKPVNNTVMDFLHDVVDGNRSAGIPETTATVVTGSGGKQSAISGQDIETQQSQFLYERNQGMKEIS